VADRRTRSRHPCATRALSFRKGLHLNLASGAIICLVTAFPIGEVARTTGVTVEALRYYEKQGLLPRLHRSAGGARRFGEEAVSRVRFIKQAQAVGLTLKDIRALVGAAPIPGSHRCRSTRNILAARIADLDRRLASMQAFRAVLKEYLDACEHTLGEQGEGSDCPTVTALGHYPRAAASGTR
jgi:DNA-binding transcriptional MerR regulator